MRVGYAELDFSLFCHLERDRDDVREKIYDFE